MAQCEWRIGGADNPRPCPCEAVQGALVADDMQANAARILVCALHRAHLGVNVRWVSVEEVLASRAVDELRRLGQQARVEEVQQEIGARLSGLLGAPATAQQRAQAERLVKDALTKMLGTTVEFEVSVDASPEDLARGLLNVSVKTRAP